MKQNRKFWHCLTGWLPILLGVLAVGGLLLGAQPASAATSGADGCIQDVWAAHGNTQSLTCTANDVRIADVTNITVNSGGSGTCTSTTGNCTCTPAATPPTNCATNPTQFGCVTFTADYRVVLGAQTRYDIGLYLATDGGGTDGALTGQCFDSVITGGTGGNAQNFDNADGDVCGDIENTAASNPQIVHLQVSTACVAGPDGKLKLPNCTSWRQPGSNAVCTQFSDAYPGSPSKCNCQPGFEVNILVQRPSISVTKTANPTQVQEGPTGGVVEYTVDVANNSTCSPTPCTPTSVKITSLQDNVYGNITDPTNPLILSTTCSVPQTIAGGSDYTCSFHATVSGLDASGINAPDHLTDTVCTSGTDANGNAVGPVCGIASVSAFNVNPTGTVSKSLNKLLCADVRYNVTVTNTDTAEQLSLSALSDDGFGDITTVHGNVLATTCSVPQTLAANGGQYNCTFDAHFCGGSHTNTVSATLSDDEGNTVSPTGSATVTVTAQ